MGGPGSGRRKGSKNKGKIARHEYSIKVGKDGKPKVVFDKKSNPVKPFEPNKYKSNLLPKRPKSSFEK